MSGAAQLAADELATGSVIAGRFRVEARLGRGGMGTVYRVCEERTGKLLALKRHALGAADETRRGLLATQFEREYHSLAELAHPRIIEVYDYGVDAGTPFYTMELLDGEDLQARAQRSWQDSCRLLLDVASSLAILHSRRLLHRDLSPRNVRCTSDGRAKLIDFGAMAAMGASKTLAGTPMFIPPEALQRQALDARSDLYALGVLAYWMLTGRYPYPAKAIADLRDVWRSPPPSVRQLRPDLPGGIDQLVMELLALDRMARPASASAVMERLATAAGLPLSEHAEVPQAYLVTPPLIARGEALERVRGELVQALSERSAVVVIEGAAGTGRSRMLDACVLEAKLLGMAVLRADASDGERGAYGVASTLCDELLEALPESAERSAGPRRALLAHVADGLADLDEPGARGPAPERKALHAALLDWWHAVARGKRIVLAIDDADAIDEPSAALLAAIAHRSGRRISLLLTRDSALPLPAALALVREVACTIELGPFAPEQTEALMRAVFGDVDHVTAVAAGVHELCDGNPRRAMALCERLVSRGVAQYEAGAWKLPAEVGAGALPDSLAGEWSEWGERSAELPPDARELAELFALCEPGALAVEQYAALTSHGDSGRSYRALDALVARGLLVPAQSRYRFAQRELGPALAALLSPERKRELNARLARALYLHDNPLLAPQHAFLAGDDAAAVARLLELHEDPRCPPTPLRVALYEQAADAARALGLPERVQIALQLASLRTASLIGEHPPFVRWGGAMLERLERESGLADYRELGELPEDQRLVAALTRAQQRHDALSEQQRGNSPFEAITSLAELCSLIVNIAMLAQDNALLERLPSLSPLVGLSPALAVVDMLVAGARDFQSGRLLCSLATYDRILERIEQPDHGGLAPGHHHELRLAVLYVKGVFAAGAGMPNATDLVAELENEPGHRVNAFRVHMTAELTRGNVEAAHACQRRAELFALQDGGQVRYRGTTARIELLAHGMAADVIGVKRAMERIEGVRAFFPGWEPTLELARGYYRRFQGDPASALVAIDRGLQLVAPGRHMDWSFLSGVRASALSDCGRHDEAIAHVLETFAQQERFALSGTTEYLLQVVAECFHAAGRMHEALAWAERCVAAYEASGRRGLGLGSGYEIRARVAAALGDVAGFEDYAQRCAREYRSGQNAALTAKYERLMRYAEGLGIAGSRRVQQAADWSRFASPASADQRSQALAAELRSCATPEQRGGRALQLVLESVGADSGVLYGLQDGRLQLIAASEQVVAPPGLARFLEAFLQAELEETGMATVIGGVSLATRSETDRFVDEHGCDWRAHLLIGRDGVERRIGAVAAVRFAPSRPALADHTRLSAIAALLLESDDIDALTWVA